jgi:hypothetical protein
VAVADILKVIDDFFGIIVYFLLLDYNAFLSNGSQMRKAFMKIDAGIIHDGPPY